jgi:hypothetical protein
VFLPATFAASGFALDKGTKWANRRILQPRTKKLGENAKQLAGESKLRIAQKTGISFGMKRNYTRQSRRQNLEREQQEYLASALENSKGLRRRAAGVSGQSGQTRAAAYAADVASKARTQDLESEMALLNDEMRNLGVDQKTFAHAAGEYLADPSDVSKQSITGSNGRTFNFNDNAPRFQRALLNSAASQGEITAIEAARMSKTVDQTMLDDIIRRNDGALKSTGGYHLATNFKLGNGRMQVRDPASGALRAPVNDEEVRTEMVAQRLMAMSQTGADSIAGMKSGLTDSSATILRTPGAFRDSVLQAMDAHAAAETATRRASNPTASPVDYRASLRTQMDQVLNPRNKETLARSDTPESDFRDIRNNI